MKGRQCGWQSQLEPGGTKEAFECRVGSWMAQQLGAHEGLRQRSSQLTGGGTRVCAKKPGFLTPCGHEPVDLQAADSLTPFAPPLHYSISLRVPAPIGPFSWPFLHPDVLGPPPPFLAPPCMCLASGPGLL